LVVARALDSSTAGTTLSGVQRPNIIWIFGDQHRAQTLGFAGDPNVRTPHLDRAARDGLYLPGAVSGSPLCCPFRGSLLSGHYPHRAVPGHQDRLPEGLPTIADFLGQAGYHTYYLGKWHLDGYPERRGRAAFHLVPPERRGGFKRWEGYENNNAPYDCWLHGGQGNEAFHERLNGYETDCLTDRFLVFLKEQAAQQKNRGPMAQPFFSVLSVQPPHDPYVAPADWAGRHGPGRVELRPNVPRIPRVDERARQELAGYHAMVENLDWNYGRIRDLLAQSDLAANTHVFFFSDHGDQLGSHGQFRKTSPWEESIRVPFIYTTGRGGYAPATGTRDWLWNHVDYVPTTLGLCGVPVPAELPGFDYSPGLLGSENRMSVPESAYLQLVRPTGHPDSIDRPWRGLVTRDRWKYVCLEGQPLAMFNLNEDPYEQANLAFNTAFRRPRQRLQEMLADWIARTADRFTLPQIGKTT
jgi:arylsulfatase A-like enzyme